MIINLAKFIEEERPCWNELEEMLDQLEKGYIQNLTIDQVKRFHYLYRRTAADLARVKTFAAEPETTLYLEALVARAYSEANASEREQVKFHPIRWLFSTFPRTFQRHVNAFWLVIAVTMIGIMFGGFALSFDPDAKSVLLPFEHLQGNPSERVAWEESTKEDRLAGSKSTFSGYLMTHNTKVSILTLAMGMTWGIGTIILLFYNGVILGSVCIDYLMAGETKFLVGWLLPHGAIEIPAILLAGQAGFVLAGALIGWGSRERIGTRLRHIGPDLITLIFGVALMLVWAGFVEAFFSQYHEPFIPYSLKISFGFFELILLFAFLFWKRSADKELNRS